MGFFDLFRRKPPVAGRAALADFIDAQSAFLAQKGVFEYSRARAGPHANQLFAEAGFKASLEQARWRAFPIALAMVAEIVEGLLRKAAGSDAGPVQAELSAQVLGVFDRYPRPDALSTDEWAVAREGLARSLSNIALHPVKPAKDVQVPFAQPYIDTMPIHEKLRERDFQALSNYLSATLCNIHEEFEKRADLAALVDALQATR